MVRERSTQQDWREWRRERAWEVSRQSLRKKRADTGSDAWVLGGQAVCLPDLFLGSQGWAQCDIAEALGVSRPAVSRWLAAAEEGGPEALLRRLHPGPTGR